MRNNIEDIDTTKSLKKGPVISKNGKEEIRKIKFLE